MRRSGALQQATLHQLNTDIVGQYKTVDNLLALNSPLHQDEAELVSLLQAVYVLLPDRETRVIQFVSASGGEGVSTIARGFAMFAATRLPDTVCLLDLDPKLSAHAEFFGLGEIGHACPVDDSLLSESWPAYRFSSLGLYIASASDGGHHALEFQPHAFEKMAQKFRRRFSLIIVDSPPLAKSAEAVMVSRQADGTVLVIEAEQTSTFAASAARRKISLAGGNLLGAVLNKRKRRLPPFLASILSR